MSDLSPASILYDAEGHPVGVVLDGALYRLQVEAKLATGHGLATEATLAAIRDTDGIKKITDPIALSGDSPKLLDNAMALEDIRKELQRIRVLMEHLTDERVHEHDLETRD
jgi:hypothetical protein